MHRVKSGHELPGVLSLRRHTGHTYTTSNELGRKHVTCCLLETQYRPSTHGFYWEVVTEAPSACYGPKFQSPRRNAGV